MSGRRVIAVLLSVVFLGLGHFYLRNIKKGTGFLLAGVGCILIASIGFGAAYFAYTILWVWALVDILKLKDARLRQSR